MPFTVPEVRMKRGSLLPLLRIPLLYGDGSPINLSGVSLQFKMKEREADFFTSLTGTASVLDAVNGLVQYAWAPGDTDVPGCYLMTVTATYPSFPDPLPMEDPAQGFIVVYLQDGLV